MLNQEVEIAEFCLLVSGDDLPNVCYFGSVDTCSYNGYTIFAEACELTKFTE